MKRRAFEQGQRVTWRDASGERQHGHVLQHTPGWRDDGGAERPEQVLVLRDNSAHISALPPDSLILAER
jgi:hypothetical protein